jgi:hypothetical protein
MRQNSLYALSAVCTVSRLLSCSISRASSSKSAMRKSARCAPITISGSGTIRSVHCGGSAQTVASSTRSRSRLPDRLYRSPTHASCWPLRGWNGCVMRTRRVAALAPPAFWIELQPPLARALSVVADRRHAQRTPLGPGVKRTTVERLSRPRPDGARGAAGCLRRHDRSGIIPRQPGAGIGKDLLTMLLHGHEILQCLPPRLQTGGNHTGEQTGDVRPMFGRVE